MLGFFVEEPLERASILFGKTQSPFQILVHLYSMAYVSSDIAWQLRPSISELAEGGSELLDTFSESDGKAKFYKKCFPNSVIFRFAARQN